MGYHANTNTWIDSFVTSFPISNVGIMRKISFIQYVEYMKINENRLETFIYDYLSDLWYHKERWASIPFEMHSIFCNIVGNIEQKIWNGLVYLRQSIHDDVIKWKWTPPSWPFVRGIHGKIPLIKTSDAEFWRCLSPPSKQTIEQTNETSVRSL